MVSFGDLPSHGFADSICREDLLEECARKLFHPFLRRSKGLERPTVIVTDLRLVSDLYEKRMHIAVTRALSLLRIVGVEAEIRKDAILAKLI